MFDKILEKVTRNMDRDDFGTVLAEDIEKVMSLMNLGREDEALEYLIEMGLEVRVIGS